MMHGYRKEDCMKSKKDGIAERKGIKFSGNLDAKDYCEKKNRHLVICKFPAGARKDISNDGNVLDNPGRFLIESLS